MGDTLIFPGNFGFDSVVVRVYVDVSLNDLQIPLVCVPVFVTGLKWYNARWNDKMQNLAAAYEAQFTKQSWGLFMELNKYRIEELRMMMTPPVYMPNFNRNGEM